MTDSNEVQGLKYVTAIECADYDCGSNLHVVWLMALIRDLRNKGTYVSELKQNYIEACLHMV